MHWFHIYSWSHHSTQCPNELRVHDMGRYCNRISPEAPVLILVVVFEISCNWELFAHFTTTKFSIFSPYMAPQVADPENYLATFEAERNTTKKILVYYITGAICRSTSNTNSSLKYNANHSYSTIKENTKLLLHYGH